MTPRKRCAVGALGATVVGVFFIGIGALAASHPAPAASAAATVHAPVAVNSPAQWLSFQDVYYTPVADRVTRGLLAASVAFDDKNMDQAATQLQSVAADLRQESAQIASTRGAGVALSRKRLQSAIAVIDQAADDIRQGKMNSRAEFDRAFDKSLYADLDRRWVAADVTTWYPVSTEAERHFQSAVGADAAKDPHVAAIEIRKAIGFLRLEAGRADTDAHRKLMRSIRELGKLADSTASGSAPGAESTKRTFARADGALTLSHEEKAKDAWAAGRFEDVGYELQAAAHDLESAAGWTGEAAEAAAAGAVQDVRLAGEDLVAGGKWTRAEAQKGLHEMDSARESLAAETDLPPNGSARAADAAGRKP